MPVNMNRRSVKLDWAIYLHEFEKKVFGEAKLPSPVVKQNLPAVEDFEFQSLLAKTQHQHWKTREQAARALADVSHPAACTALIPLLKDEHHAVSWAAMNSLVRHRRAAVRPLLEALTRDFQSSCFLKAARHTLGALNECGELTHAEIRVLHALNTIGTGLIVAQIANEALIVLQQAL